MNRSIGLFAALALTVLTPAVALAQEHVHTTTQPDAIAAIRADDRVVGSPDAPVTLTAYVSTTCSHCADWHNNYLPAIMARYVDTGQIKIVYRDLPTPPADVAAAGAVMARCAPADKFDAVLTSFYRTQGALRGATDEELKQNAMRWLATGGVAGGMTREQMNACFDDEANWNALDVRIEASHADGVTGTPTFFVNGQRAEAVWDVTSLDAVVQPLLAAR